MSELCASPSASLHQSTCANETGALACHCPRLVRRRTRKSPHCLRKLELYRPTVARLWSRSDPMHGPGRVRGWSSRGTCIGWFEDEQATVRGQFGFPLHGGQRAQCVSSCRSGGARRPSHDRSSDRAITRIRVRGCGRRQGSTGGNRSIAWQTDGWPRIDHQRSS